MATRMLIDARHQEETRVAVLKGNRIEEFDFESADKKQIKGNIYLAKVTRVEPSLQAAFVDFGGNRHGFLAFSEIHPDYYQIPKEDRDALLAAEAEAAEEEARLRAEEEERGEMPGDEYDAEDESAESLAEDLAEDGLEEVDTSDKDDVLTLEDGRSDKEDENDAADGDDSSFDEAADEQERDERDGGRGGRGRGRRRNGGRTRAKEVDDARARRLALRRRYKIQDVIQRRQVLLVQVVKEERGNKGAALTSYLSLAGRYTVLMPNSSHGGGISRKISSAGDRKRLKEIVGDLALPQSMGLIVRTAGLSRTKTEIKRDFDYLARLWDEIRENTLASAAPALIHSDSDLIKRAIRDIYNRDIEEVIVEGAAGYRAAKAFMKMLMPSHARRVKEYADPVPLFQRFGAEDQLKAMYDPVVQLKSGGYLVINPTEALVSIDINSGRSTREHNIEQTALSTNLEAAKEIARQLRLRDMAGLVVIDFIDMEHHSNTRKVEKAMKDALKHDRARIQVGRISSFGLMEMSRQRLRTGVLEATTRECPHCDGTGLVRTASSAGLSALRLIGEEAARGRGTHIRLAASTEAAIYLLNEKRADLMEIEARYGVVVEVVPEGEEEGAKMSVSSHGPKPTKPVRFEPVTDEIDLDDDEDDVDVEDEDQDVALVSDRRDDTTDDGETGERKKSRRRRRGGRGRNRRGDGGEFEDRGSGDTDDESGQNDNEQDDDQSHAAEGDAPDERQETDQDGRRKRRRGGRRRSGRGRDRNEEATALEDGGVASEDAAALEEVSAQVAESMAVVAGPDDAPQTAEAAAAEDDGRTEGRTAEAVAADEASPPPKRQRRAPRPRKAKPAASDTDANSEAAASEVPTGDAEVAEPVKRPRARRKKTDEAPLADAAATTPEAEEKPAKPRRTRRKAEPAPATGEEGAAVVPEGAAEVPEAPPAPAQAEQTNASVASEAEPEAKPRRGWWQRTFGE